MKLDDRTYVYEGSFIRLIVTLTGQPGKLVKVPGKEDWGRTPDTLKAKCIIQDMRTEQDNLKRAS